MTDTMQVPREATEEMMQAGLDASPARLVDKPTGGRWRQGLSNHECAEVYRAMIAAAPDSAPDADAIKTSLLKLFDTTKSGPLSRDELNRISLAVMPYLLDDDRRSNLALLIARLVETAFTVAAAPQATDPRDAEIADLRAYALELQRALTGLTLGGSEFFVRHGEEFRADIRACVARVNEVKASAHDRLLEAVRERKAAESRIATLTAERDALREALDSIRIYGQDTLSGRADGPDDRAWQREAVREMTSRAIRALSTQPSKTETRE
jgi:hypothetical protein